jgi:hypothetical protein
MLLFVRPRAGLLLTLLIIVSDVSHNTWLMSRSPAPQWSNWLYVLQVVFLIFVLLTIPRAWRVAPVTGSPKYSFDGDTAKATHR